MRAFVLSTGDELVRGRTQDTNTSTLARELAAEGVSVVGAMLVGDDLAALVEAIRHAAAHAEVVVISGGLGPTEDDCTRRAAATAADVGLVRLPELETKLTDLAARLGRRLSPSNLLQADVPAGAEVLANRVGTAAGFSLRIGAATLFALPGPPHELAVVLHEELLPRLRALLADRPIDVVRTRTIETLGLPESRVGEQLGALMARDRVPRVGTTASFGTIRLVVHAEGAAADVEEQLAATEAEIRARVGDIVYGVDGDPIEQVVGRALIASGTTISTAESCTGGGIAHALTSVSGISAVFPGGVVVYSAEEKCRLARVPAELIRAHGVVSEEVARAMAEGVRAEFGTDLGLAVTGLAGPGDDGTGKRVGLVHIALATADETLHLERVFPGEREFVRILATKYALDLVRRGACPGGGFASADASGGQPPQ